MIEYVRYLVPQSQGAAFELAYRRAGRALAGSSHYRGHEVSRCVEDPQRWMVRIVWDSVDGHLEGFRRSPEFARFFEHVAPFVSMIEEMHHYDVVEPTPPPTLYAWAGGHDALVTWLGVFYDTVLDDELLRDLFSPMPPDHVEHVARWLGEVFGGPAVYTERHGGHAGMIGHHRGRRVSQAQRARWQELLMAAADEVGLPADAEFRASVVSYVEWGTRLAVAFSAEDAPPTPSEPTPVWDWVRRPWGAG